MSHFFDIKKHLLFSIVILFFVALTLIWIAHSRINDYKSYHRTIAAESTSSAALDISSFISEQRRLVNIFGQDHLQLIQQLANQPENDALHQKLKQRIRLYFPEFFAFTITNNDGIPYLEDFDGLIGTMCLNDLKGFTLTGKQRPRIHPHPEVYHFDISVRLADGLILFISFHADILGNILSVAQTPGHHLMLIHAEASQLIEVTDKGARINTPRNDYRLQAAEKRRILFGKPIPGTRWTVSDFHDNELFSTFRYNIILNYSFIFTMFSLVVTIMLFVIRKEEGLRRDAERHKDDFLSIINHELRTPITSIMGSLGLVAHGATGKINDKAKNMIDIALSNSERLNMLINDLLEIKKFEAGKMELDLRPTPMDSFIRQCLDSHQGYADTYDVSFHLQHAQPELVARIDRDRISQVMSNLLSNAAKYGAKQDSIEINVLRHNNYARISVTDHGPGIPEDFHDRLFQKFTQSSIKHHKGGTGLGLSIVKMIIEAHQGHISFETSAQHGTTFHIDLPLQASHTAG